MEGLIRLIRRFRLVRHLVEMIVHHLTKINERVLLDLDSDGGIDLYAGGVHDTQIADVILAVLADNHQLRLPQFFVVGDLVVVGFAFADFEHAGGTVNTNLKIFQLVSVHSLEVHVELVG